MTDTNESLGQLLSDERENQIQGMRKRFGFNYDTAEEIYHQVIEAVLNRGASRIRNPLGYLKQTIRNKSCKWKKASQRMRPSGHGEELERLGRVLLREDAYRSLEDLIEKLPDEADRSILRMKAKGLTFQLIASELQMKPGTVRRRHCEAVAQLRKFRVAA